MPIPDQIPTPDGFGVTCAEALEAVAATLTAIGEAGYADGGFVELPPVRLESDTALCTYRLPSEYMRPGMTPWTTQEREHIERVNAAMVDGWSDAYRERLNGGDDA